MVNKLSHSCYAMAGLPDQSDFTHSMNAEYIYNDLINMIAGNKEATKSIVDLNMTLFNKIEALEIEHKNIHSSLQPLIERLSSYERELSYLKHDKHLLRQKLALTEDTTKTMYLRLEGLGEQ